MNGTIKQYYRGMGWIMTIARTVRRSNAKNTGLAIRGRKWLVTEANRNYQ